MMHRMGLVFATLTLTVLWSLLFHVSCTSTKKEEKSTEAQDLSKDEAKKLEDLKVEMDVGRSMAGRLLAFYGIVDDKRLRTYINQVGGYVASYGDYPDRRYMFQIIDSDIVNAFACPGGYILVTSGAIRHAKNEAELAHVLGHEAAHVGKRHMFNTLQDMTDDELDKAAKEAEKALNLPPSVQVRKRPEVEANELGSMAAKYLSGGSAGLSIFQAAKAGMNLILEKGLGAELEYEADREGVKYAIRAGYDPFALSQYLCRLKNKGNDEKCVAQKLEPQKKGRKAKKPATELEKTHPPIEERIANIDTLLASMSADEIIGAKGEKRFQKQVKRLPKPKSKKDKS